MSPVPAKPPEERFWPKVARVGDDDCWLWQASLTSYGYGQIMWKQDDGAWRPMRSHRVAYTLTNGPIPEGVCVLHSCDNPPCCNPAHLRLGTMADNMADKVDRGRARGGAKLTADVVREIRARAGVDSQKVLANEYGVHQSAVSKIIGGKHWKWVV